MKRAIWLPSMCALALALLTIPQGCGFTGSQPNGVAPIPAPDAPKPVTDLSQLAPGSALNPFGDPAAAKKIVSDSDLSQTQIRDSGGSGPIRHVGDPKHPGEEQLLNKKAAKFELVSGRLLDQVFEEMAQLQRGENFSRLKLPTDTKWVVITGTMNDHGVLKEIVLDQHSGTAAVDKLVIAACKKGIYIHNPPPEALDANGNYSVRIEARFENFASLDGEHWSFKTYLGLALL